MKRKLSPEEKEAIKNLLKMAKEADKEGRHTTAEDLRFAARIIREGRDSEAVRRRLEDNSKKHRGENK